MSIIQNFEEGRFKLFVFITCFLPSVFVHFDFGLSDLSAVGCVYVSLCVVFCKKSCSYSPLIDP